MTLGKHPNLLNPDSPVLYQSWVWCAENQCFHQLYEVGWTLDQIEGMRHDYGLAVLRFAPATWKKMLAVKNFNVFQMKRYKQHSSLCTLFIQILTSMLYFVHFYWRIWMVCFISRIIIHKAQLIIKHEIDKSICNNEMKVMLVTFYRSNTCLSSFKVYYGQNVSVVALCKLCSVEFE